MENLAKNIQHVLSNVPQNVGGPKIRDYIQNTQGGVGTQVPLQELLTTYIILLTVPTVMSTTMFIMASKV